ncbi:hypothetical protein K5X82_05245 [Halosquirtibacter xylanolyticus]|uniref:hypothetical protein n=1 Tax=Halosquirtibacter xylanolyticus TaxID=3374599 RepID=UPI003749C587|nr:hypothetical protein K5X82_05245 [Prolixibacteraceae bacterium]
MNIQLFIIICCIQIVGLQLTLLRKKYRNLPNGILNIILTGTICHYGYYYLLYSGIIHRGTLGEFLINPTVLYR